MKSLITSLLFIALGISIADGVGKSLSKADPQNSHVKPDIAPNVQICTHRASDMLMSVSNWGVLGNAFNNATVTHDFCGVTPDYYMPSLEYPRGSASTFLYFGALWVGAIVGNDTLVSTGADGWQLMFEMYPDAAPSGVLVKTSSDVNDPNYSPEAVAQEEISAVYFDTLANPAYNGYNGFDTLPHVPLGLKIHQHSYIWTDAANSKFIVFRYRIKNIGHHFLSKMYFGVYWDADIYNLNRYGGWGDDYAGSYECTDLLNADTSLIAWMADNDGDPTGGVWDSRSVRAAIGVSLIDLPATVRTNFNWWVSSGASFYDWGPRLAANYRHFGNLEGLDFLGTPEGDRNKYYIMSHPEIDYDQMWSAIDKTSEGWLPPPTQYLNDRLPFGDDTKFLLSFGSVDLAPGDSTEFAFVVAMGDNFHKNPNDFQNLFSAANPRAFYDSLDFSDLTNNVIQARQLYRCVMGKMRGDANGDCQLAISDVVALVNYIFKNGTPPVPATKADVNCDSKVNLTDAVYLVNYIFSGGPAPCDP